MKNLSLFVLFTIALFFYSCSNQPSSPTRESSSPDLPNIVIFYVDDLGYGDLGCYGAQGVKTPAVDRLATNGIQFTDAHSTAATCTPSRYSLLTGEYAFRSNAAILPGDAPLLINMDRPTLPAMLQQAGYRTAVVGKWHLGLGLGDVDWNDQVKPGPLEVGFDYSFLLPATGDRVPTVYLENHRVVNLSSNDPLVVSYEEKVGDRPTGLERPDLLRVKADTQHSQTIINGVSRIGTMGGGQSAVWVDEDFPDVFTGKAKEFIETSKDQPFFLFFSFHDIHVPRLPHERFKGKSEMGVRGDAIAQMDWMTGEVMRSLDELGVAENTLIIFTSDNGPVLNDGYEDLAVEMLGSHSPGGAYRGGKYSAFEAGTRVPMIVSFPSKINEPKINNALISQVDIYASLAQLTGQQLANTEAIDSQGLLETLMGESKGRTFMLEESFTLSLRKNNWKYISPLEGKQLPTWINNKQVESGLSRDEQLYNLSLDVNESHNIANEYPELLSEMKNKIEEIKQRSERGIMP